MWNQLNKASSNKYLENKSLEWETPSYPSVYRLIIQEKQISIKNATIVTNIIPKIYSFTTIDKSTGIYLNP